MNDNFPSSQASDNPLQRSQRSNAMYPTRHEKIDVPKKARVATRHSQGLNRSAYVRNDNAFSVIKTNVANGTSKSPAYPRLIPLFSIKASLATRQISSPKSKA